MAQTVVAMQTWLSPARANRYNSLMRRLTFVGWGLLSLSCATTPAFTSERLPDGSYQLQCKMTLPSCLDRVDEVCDGTPYEVLSAHDHRKPIDIMVGGYQKEARSSDAIVRCTKGKPLFGPGSEPTPPPAPIAAPPPLPPRVCIPGATQACVGLGGCSGGQACVADGSGFGPCNCSVTSPAADGGVN
jgi:hypothetical protein